MKMKVAIIIERANPGLGGAERSVLELAEALAGLDIDTHILAAKGRAESANTHITFPGPPSERTPLLIFGRALRNHLQENHYDIIHSVLPFDFADIYQPRGGTYAESIIRNAASYSGKLVELWKRTTSFLNLRRKALLKAERNLCRMRAGPAIVAISQYVAEQFKRHYKVKTDRITVIPNGVKISEPDTEKAGRLRMKIFSRLGIKITDSPVLFLFAANNFRLKGLDCLINALKLVSSKPAFLVVVGSDKTDSCHRLAEKYNVSNRVLFLGEVDRITELLAVTDVAALPTFYDPCSRFILEALAAGKPVITTKFNGAAEQFTDTRHGRIIDRPDDIASLAEALAFFTEPANIRKASQAIKEDNIKQQVSISRVAEQLKSFYITMLDKGKLK